MLESFFAPLFASLFAPLLYPFDPSRRVFIVFLVSSAIIVIVYHRRCKSRQQVSRGLSQIFSKGLWYNPSTWLDIRSLFINSLIKSAFITPYLVSKLTVILAVSSFLYTYLGSSPFTASPSHLSNHYLLIMLTFSITLFIVEDFGRFIQHKLMHGLPWLWRIHKVHHQAEVLTPITLYRIHPLEIALSNCRNTILLGSVTGCFVYAFPGNLSALEILGVDAFGFLFNAMGANLRHSPIPVSFGRLNHCFISPMMHQIHHSQDPQHHHKNFGSCLAIWDHCFGSFYAEPPANPMRFGCGDTTKHSLSELYLQPLNVFTDFKQPLAEKQPHAMVN